MTKDDVERWAAHSAAYAITSRKDSIYKFAQKDDEPFSLSFDVWFAKGVVTVVKTYNINNFEVEDNELKHLKALRPVRTNACWVRQNYVDSDSFSNG